MCFSTLSKCLRLFVSLLFISLLSTFPASGEFKFTAIPDQDTARLQERFGTPGVEGRACRSTLFNHSMTRYPDKEFPEAACKATQRLRAAAAGDVATLQKTTDEGSITARMVACRKKQLASVQVLVTTSIDAQSPSGCTALYLAAEEGDECIVRLLLDRRADVALAASDGGTPLQRACEFGHDLCALALIEAKASNNARLPNGEAALNLACQNGQLECTKALALDRHVRGVCSHRLLHRCSAPRGGAFLIATVLVGSCLGEHARRFEIPRLDCNEQRRAAIVIPPVLGCTSLAEEAYHFQAALVRRNIQRSCVATPTIRAAFGSACSKVVFQHVDAYLALLHIAQ